MKAGRTLQELATEIARQSAGKRDFLADTRDLAMLTTRAGSKLRIATRAVCGLRPLVHEQIADYLDIPRKFYGRLRDAHPELLDHNVNALLRHEPKRRMVRTLDGQVRAFLSDRYRRLDNDELAEAILPVLGEIPDVEFPSTEITETRLYIKAVAPHVTGEVRKGDFVQAGVVISNSEVGMGALLVQPLVYRLVCTNGMIAGTATRRFHVGRQVDSTDAMEVYRDETLRADDRAFWLKVRDVVRAAVEETRFRAIVERMRLSAETASMVDPSRGVEELGRRFHLGEQEQASVLRHLTLGGDLTQYGALNAVTRASQDVQNYDRATELEAIGGAILAMNGREWRTVAEAAR
jgi:Domain of unknown function (DUF932)